MTGIHLLAFLWTLIIMHTGCVCSDVQFFERSEGESVVLPCAVDQTVPSPFGVYLMRSWLRPRPSQVLYMHTKEEFKLENNGDKHRTSVSGDPSSRSLNVTLSQLRAGDTDRYYCEFLVENSSSVDDRLPGKTEFFLLVKADAPGSDSVGLVETCAGGSAVLPCLPIGGQTGLEVEGVSLKRQRGREGPVEVVYHSKRHHDNSIPPPSSSSSFSGERVHLSSAPGPGGLTYQLTIQQLQPDDSALYSCQLLQRGTPDHQSSSGLGRQVFFVSVQGGQCGCTSYSTLLYALSSAVAILLLLLVGVVLINKGRARSGGKSQPQGPIYEEMTRVKPLSRKLASQHLEEVDCSEYTNGHVKKSCPENHYESPIGVSQK